MVKRYTPKQGDVVLLDFNPTKGHEQCGFRPAVVISNNVFNEILKWLWYAPFHLIIRIFQHIIIWKILKKYMVLFYVNI